MSKWCVTLLSGLLMVGSVQADEDHDKARKLKEMGKILPLEKVLQAAQRRHPGRVIDVELEKENGRYVYEIELLGESGEVWELYFDASNGEFIKRKLED